MKSTARVISIAAVLLSAGVAPVAAEFSGGDVIDAPHASKETSAATATEKSAEKKKAEQGNRNCITNNVTRQSRPSMPPAAQTASASGLKPDMTGFSAGSGLSQGFAQGASVIQGQGNVLSALVGAVAAFSVSQKQYSRTLGNEKYGLNAFDQNSAAKLGVAQAAGNFVAGSAVFAQGAGQRLATQVVTQGGAANAMKFDPAAAAAMLGPAGAGR